MSQQHTGAGPIEKVGSGVPAISVPRREPLDVATRFGFERVPIDLGPDGAWSIDGITVMAFGPGAIRLGREAGVCILKPQTIRIGEEVHPNPYIEYNAEGQPSVFHIVKHGIMIDRTGAIRYLPPVYDRMDISAYIAERALKAKVHKDTPPADAREATRTQAEAWNALAKKPGDPVWWFVPVQGTEIGIAFNLQSKAWPLRTLQTDIVHFRKNIFRRFETASDRRIIYSLVYESMIAVKDPPPEIVWWTKSKGTQFEKQVVDHVKRATFIVDKPTRAGIEFGVLQELAIAIREDNEEKRANLLASFAEMTGLGEMRVVEARLAEDPTGPVTVDGEIVDAEPAEARIDPVPEHGTAKDFAAYFREQLPKVDLDQWYAITAALGFEDADQGLISDDDIIKALGKDSRKAVAQLMRKFVAAQEKAEAKPATPEEAKAYLLEEMAAGAVARIETLMKAEGLKTDVSLDMVPDETVLKIYDHYVAGIAPDGDGGES